MNDQQYLIDGYLDETLSPDDSIRLQTLVKTSPEFARQLAGALMLHDRLRTESTLPEASSAVDLRLSTSPAQPARRWLWPGLSILAAALLLGLFMLHDATVSTATAANLAVERLIAAASQPIDRMYRIRITDFGPGGPHPQVAADRGGVKPNVDGAELSVRGRDQFVLIRRFADGTPFVTGSDGEIGWAVPPTGRVHLSRDIRRFRRAVPGERDAIPFLDLQASLQELQRKYDLQLTAGDAAAIGKESWSRLDAAKQPHVRGGAQRVSIWFDAAGTAYRISLQGLPQGEPDGSPHAVELELVTGRELPPNYFHHESHHAVDRPEAWE